MLVLSREAGSVLNLVKSDHIGVAIDKHRRLRRKSLLLSHVVLFRWHGIDCPFGTIRFKQQTRKWADANNDD